MSAQEKVRCRATKLDGTPCRFFLNLSADGLCPTHDPARKTDVAAMWKKGGQASQVVAKRRRQELRDEGIRLDVPERPTSLAELGEVQSWVAFETYSGRMDARTSEATTKALRNQQLIYEKRDLLDQVQKLRKQLAEVQKAKR